ncbi:hypothetical protein H6503_06595 [Candidatus Woesearchaeota archaeon]|nr:hypothetical protein [Candidatus Woesearchaeota archaeon]
MIMKDSTHKIIALFVLAVFGLLHAVPVNAEMQLNDISFDPAIVAAGDEVDIVIQYEAQPIDSTSKITDADYKFQVKLLPDDSLTEKYVIVQDAAGDNLFGSVLANTQYNKRFRVKVMQNAPAGNYQFRLEGTWYRDGKVVETAGFVRFTMPVKKEGIILDISNVKTTPLEIRPGFEYINLETSIDNVGEKDAKAVEIILELPENITSSYSDNNRLWVGLVEAGSQKKVTFSIDIDEEAASGVYNIKAKFNYMDIDNNKYTKVTTFPLLVESRPYLEVVNVTGSGLAGDTSKLEVTIKNVGEQSAEAVDVRIIKQNSQPFTMDVRSDYIGELEPGETGTAIFTIKANSDAETKVHDFKLLIRSMGDSDEGDDTLYTFNRRAQFEITGKKPNYMLIYGLIGAVLVIGIYLFTRRKKK